VSDASGVRRRTLGANGPEVSVVSVGTSPLGSTPSLYGHEVSADQAITTVRRVFESGINFLDTANEYGGGDSERRVGEAIRQAGGLPAGFVLATKADPIPGVRDFSGERVRTSYLESVERLGVDHFELFHLHDPERFGFEELTAPGGAVDAMQELKRDGRVGLIGVAGGDLREMRRYVDLGVFDVLLTHTQYTLLDQSADGLIDHARDAGMAVLNAGPYASGMLAKPDDASSKYRYQAPGPEVRIRTEAIRSLCERFGVPLAAVALQFSTRDPRILSTIVGVSSPERVDELVRNETLVIPTELWDALADLVGFVPGATS